jgi:hypothetical protein
MSVGPREAQRRALREKGAGGIAVLEKTRTAPPSPKAAAGGSGPPKRPPGSEVVAGGPEKSKGFALLVRDIPDPLRGRLERTRAKRGLRSVNAAVLELLDEGAEK